MIRSAEPGIASLLAPALSVIAQQPFVHLAGEGNQLWITFTRMALPYFASAVEEYMLLLETAACAIDGLPLPARLAAPAAPTQALPR
ncbi:MAG: hypothetical protein QM784_33145 [Polyangiaceae bacterium]